MAEVCCNCPREAVIEWMPGTVDGDAEVWCMGCFIDDKLRAEVTVKIAEQVTNNRANRLTVEVCA